MKIKRLNFSEPDTGVLYWLLRHATSMSYPIVGKPGWYKRGSLCWVELSDGRAFQLHDCEQFDIQLAILTASELNPKQVAALRAICAEGLATKQQRQMLYYCEHAKTVVHEAYKSRQRSRKALKKLLEYGRYMGSGVGSESSTAAAVGACSGI